MEARIILSGADFSANNIGKFAQMNPLTKRILAKQTQYTEDSEEAAALDVFIKGLVAGGFIGGQSPLITHLCIPALASSHAEFLYNIAQLDGDGYPVNEMVQGEAEGATKVFRIVADPQSRIVGTQIRVDSGGVAVADFDERVALPNYLNFPQSGNIPNLSVFCYNLTNYADQTTNNQMIKAYNSTVRALSLASQNVGLSNNYQDYGWKSEGTSMLGFVGGSLNNPAIEAYADNANFTQLLVSDTPFEVSYAGSDKLKLGQYVYQTARQARMALWGCGHYLDATKMTELRSLIAQLMSALHVAAYIG